MDELRRPVGGDRTSPAGGPALLGDVVLCPAVATEQAPQAGHSLDDELHLLTVHGVLHLLGYDHAEPAEEREMFDLQARILDEFHRADRASRRRIAQRDADTGCSECSVWTGRRNPALRDNVPRQPGIADSPDGADVLGPAHAGCRSGGGRGGLRRGRCRDGTVSRARVEALVRSGRFGARALALCVADRPRHINLLLLLRLSCELTATVLVTLAVARALSPTWLAVLVAGLAMVLVTYVIVGVVRAPSAASIPTPSVCSVAGPVLVLGRVLGPLSRLLILSAMPSRPAVVFRKGRSPPRSNCARLVDMAGQRGVVEEGEAGDDPVRFRARGHHRP